MSLVQSLPDDPARLAALCALWQGSESDIWITLQGGSMAPTFLPGSRLHVHCSRRSIAPNDIAVFQDGSRLVAHRVVKIMPSETGQRQFLCLGDGNVFPDALVSEPDILGIVIDAAPTPLWKRLAYFIQHPRRHGRYALRRLRPVKFAASIAPRLQR